MKMMKIMIVDDMPVFREYLTNCIDWNAYGFELCCEAKNGKEALEKFEDFYPDIVLTDITMPHIDGLELAERLLKDYPDTSVVLITGHSEFEYARQALKLGVYDYIVKPFEKEELVLTLLKLQDNINKLVEREIEKDKISKEKREMALRKLIYFDKSAHTPDLIKILANEKITFPTEFFLVCTLSIAKYDNPDKVEEVFKWESTILNILDSMLVIDGKAEMFKDFEGNLVTILNFQTKEQLMEYKGYEFEDLIKIIKEHLAFDISVGISDYCFNIEKIQDAYYETLQALSNQYTDNNRTIFDYKKTGLVGANTFYSWDVIEGINANLEILNYDNIEKIISEELDNVEINVRMELKEMMYMSLLGLLLAYIMEVGRSIDDILSADFNPYDLLSKSKTHQKKKDFILKCYKTVIDYQLDNMDTEAYLMAAKAREYIEKNYSNSNLSIDDISRHLLLNQTYLRRMFKSEVNMTIMDFLIKTRMDKARELVINTQYKIADIGKMVGYGDPSYFSKSFKKYHGVSPSNVIPNK